MSEIKRPDRSAWNYIAPVHGVNPPQKDGVVFVIDDDPDVLKALSRLLRSGGLDVQTYQSANEFLDQHDPAAAGCLVVDVSMPGLSGLDLQETLLATNAQRMIVFLTGQGDIAGGVRAMRAGAVHFLTKPVSDKDLLDAVGEALLRDRKARHARAETQSVQARLETLTPRERQVLRLVVAGRLNKQIAAELGTAEKTVKVHRSRVMKKMRAGSIVELVRLADVGVRGWPDVRPGQ